MPSILLIKDRFTAVAVGAALSVMQLLLPADILLNGSAIGLYAQWAPASGPESFKDEAVAEFLFCKGYGYLQRNYIKAGMTI